MSDFPHVHPEYKEHLPRWQRWRDVVEGEDEIKEKENRGKYLPRLFGQSEEEYSQYIEFAEWYGATGRTVDAMVGAHHRSPITAALGRLEPLREQACHGLTLQELAQKATRQMWTVGRLGLLGEFSTQGAPQVYLYTAEAIVNWRYEEDELVFAVVCETYEAPSDKSPYVYEHRKQYRFLELIEGRYIQRVMRKTKGRRGEDVWLFDETLTVIPTTAGGAPLSFIPFVIVDFEGADGEIGGSPIADLASLNLKHYRVSADKASYLHISACPILHIDGLTEEERPKVLPMGSRLVIYTMGAGKVAYAETEGRALSALREDLVAKEDQMARLGGSFLRAQKKSAETAEAMRLAQSGESSVLSQICNVLSKGLTRVVRALAEWSGIEAQSVSVALPSDFFEVKIEQWEADFLFKLYQSGLINLEAFLEGLQGGGLIKREWIQQLINRGAAAPFLATGASNGTQEDLNRTAPR